MANLQDPRKEGSPESVNEILQNRIVRHLLFLTRLSTQEARKVVEKMDADVLPALEDRIVAAVNRLQGMSGATNLLTTGQQRYMEQFAGQLQGATASLMSTVRENLFGRILEVAKGEVDFEHRLFQKAIPVKWTFSTPTEAQLESILSSQPFDGKPLREWFDDLSAGTTSQVNQAIRQGMTEGEGIPQIMQRIRGTRAGNYTDGILGTTRRHSEALARSGVIFASDQATTEFYRQNDDIIKGVKWVLTLDSRTCPRCVRKEEESPYELGEAPIAPVHPNCRCTKVAVTKSWRELGIDLDEAPEGTRASMNGQVPESLTYNQWLKKQPKHVVDDALGPARSRLFREGNLPVTSFTNREGQELSLQQIRDKEADLFMDLNMTRDGRKRPDFMSRQVRAGSVEQLNMSTSDRRTARKVLDSGREDGNEHSILLDGERELLYKTSGDKDMVEFIADELSIMNNSENNITLHHNHPNDVPLSPADILITRRAGMKDIMAHTQQGGNFRGRLIKDPFFMESRYENISQGILERMRKWRKDNPEAGLDILNGNFIYQHFTLLKLRDEGIIDYRYNLSSQAVGWLDEFDLAGLLDEIVGAL